MRVLPCAAALLTVCMYNSIVYCITQTHQHTALCWLLQVWGAAAGLLVKIQDLYVDAQPGGWAQASPDPLSIYIHTYIRPLGSKYTPAMDTQGIKNASDHDAALPPTMETGQTGSQQPSE